MSLDRVEKFCIVSITACMTMVGFVAYDVMYMW